MEQILQIFFYFGLIVFWIDAEPMIYFKRALGFKEENYDDYNKIKKAIHRLIYCGFCSGFWIILIITQDFNTAIIVSTVYYMWSNR